jgi:hypothetical protein
MAYTFSFSYSKFTKWAKCPQAFKFSTIDKIDKDWPTPPALIEGRKVHDDIGNYLQGKTDVMPEKLAYRFSMLGDQIRDIATGRSNAKKAIVEEQMAFDASKKRVKWFGKNARYRFIWDAAIYDAAEKSITAVDWKTGKPYGSYDDQMQIFSVPAFWEYPEVEKFTGYLAYLDTGDISDPLDYTYTREQFERTIWPAWERQIAEFEADTTFAPTPSRDACRFCDFHQDRNGPCTVGV